MKKYEPVKYVDIETGELVNNSYLIKKCYKIIKTTKTVYKDERTKTEWIETINEIRIYGEQLRFEWE